MTMGGISGDHFQRIYRERAEDYDRLVAAEDTDGRLLPAIERVAQRLDRPHSDLPPSKPRPLTWSVIQS